MVMAAAVPASLLGLRDGKSREAKVYAGSVVAVDGELLFTPRDGVIFEARYVRPLLHDVGRLPGALVKGD